MNKRRRKTFPKYENIFTIFTDYKGCPSQRSAQLTPIYEYTVYPLFSLRVLANTNVACHYCKLLDPISLI